MRRVALIIPVLLAAQTIRVDVNVVSVPVLVLSREGRVVSNLHSADFHLFDDDKPRPFVLDRFDRPVSIAVAIQANQDVRDYLPFIARIGNALDALLIGEGGESAVLVYGDEVTIAKPFESGELSPVMHALAPDGRNAHTYDAGMRAIELLRSRRRARRRILLFIGQPSDHGSAFHLDDLRDAAETHDITVHALTLPELGKTFVSDTFSLTALSSSGDRGGFKAGADLARLVPTLSRTAAAAGSVDPFSVLAAATGGTQLHFRRQNQLEDAVSIIGVELRSAYVLSFSAADAEPGYHSLRVEVDLAGAQTHARPGYRFAAK
jgi:VWFA-related protein